MKYLTSTKEWKSVSFLLWLLKEQVCSLSTTEKSDEEFDKAFKKDAILRKSLELEIRDIAKVVNQLQIITKS